MINKKLSYLLIILLIFVGVVGCVQSSNQFRKTTFPSDSFSPTQTNELMDATSQKNRGNLFQSAHFKIFTFLMTCGLAVSVLFEIFLGSKFSRRIDILWICLILMLILPVFFLILTYGFN